MEKIRAKPDPKMGLDYWREQVGLWQASGLTQAEFCRQNNVNPSRLSNWRSKIDQLDKRERQMAARAARNGFVELPLGLPLQTPGGGPLIEIGVEADGRIVLRLSPRTAGGR